MGRKKLGKMVDGEFVPAEERERRLKERKGNLKDIVEAGLSPIEKGKEVVDKLAWEMTERARQEKELKELPKLDWEKPAVETLGEYDKGLEHDPIIESVAMPANAIRKGLMSVGGTAILEGLGQAKNYGVSKIKG
jgi:hypothetical protein